MAYDDGLAERVRAALARHADSVEIAMFGGLCWTVNTHMAVGVVRNELMVHVGKDGYDDALDRGARPAVMGQRTMHGVVLVDASDLPDESSLDAWIGPAVERALAKKPKPPRRARPSV